LPDSGSAENYRNLNYRGSNGAADRARPWNAAGKLKQNIGKPGAPD
jgi:hypothetical protein